MTVKRVDNRDENRPMSRKMSLFQKPIRFGFWFLQKPIQKPNSQKPISAIPIFLKSCITKFLYLSLLVIAKSYITVPTMEQLHSNSTNEAVNNKVLLLIQNVPYVNWPNCL